MFILFLFCLGALFCLLFPVAFWATVRVSWAVVSYPFSIPGRIWRVLFPTYKYKLPNSPY